MHVLPRTYTSTHTHTRMQWNHSLLAASIWTGLIACPWAAACQPTNQPTRQADRWANASLPKQNFQHWIARSSLTIKRLFVCLCVFVFMSLNTLNRHKSISTQFDFQLKISNSHWKFIPFHICESFWSYERHINIFIVLFYVRVCICASAITSLAHYEPRYFFHAAFADESLLLWQWDDSVRDPNAINAQIETEIELKLCFKRQEPRLIRMGTTLLPPESRYRVMTESEPQ